MERLTYHPLSQLIPEASQEDRAKVRISLEQNGFIPGFEIVTYNDQLLDGRTRYEECLDLGIDPPTKEYVGDSPAAYVFAANVPRRHLSTVQVLEIAEALRQHLSSKAKQRQALGKGYLAANLPQGSANTDSKAALSHGSVDKQIASLANTSERTARSYHAIQKKGSDELIEAVKNNDISISDAASILAMPKPEQTEAVQKVRRGKARTARAAALLCERCSRVGSIPDCPACQIAREQAQVNARGQKKKRGRKPKTPEVRAEIKDQTGQSVPENLRDVFAAQDLPTLIADLGNVAAMFSCDSWVQRAGKLCDHYRYIQINHFRDRTLESLHQLQLAVEALEAGLPHAACPKCNGAREKDSKPCDGCRGGGHVPDWRYAELTKVE